MKNKVGFIGAGNMAGAIISGIAGSLYDCDSIAVFDVDEKKRKQFFLKGMIVEDSAKDLVKNTEIVFLTVKPAHLNEVLEEIKDSVVPDNIFVSVVAGVSIGYIKEKLGVSDVAVVRAMPNTPVLLGKGATALSFDKNISDEKIKLVSSIFERVGVFRIIDERYMNAVISVNGSSPAYVYMFIKAIADGAVKQGIDIATALDLATATVIGAAEMVKASSVSVDELIRAVCSPNGTTLEAVRVLEEKGFEKIIITAMDACTQRASELEGEIKGNDRKI